jgi:16S rRNA (guanine527-N7)-methyltransferase
MPEPVRAMFEEDIGTLVDMLTKSGVCVRSDAAEMLFGLATAIHDWNQRVNLISRKDIERLITYHFCDAASLLPIARPDAGLRVLDVGGSNGLPGLVLSAISPDLRVTVCDSRRKREGFLRDACAVLKGTAAYVIDRVDGDRFRSMYGEGFDLVVARAVAQLKLLLRWCLPLVRPGGFLVAYKGSRCADEVRQADGYIWSHGANLVMILGSPFGANCNPLRRFAVVGKSS